MFWFKKHQWQEHRFKDGGKSVSSPPAGPCVPESTQIQVMTANHKLLANKKSGDGLRSTGMDAVWTPSFTLLSSWYAPGPFPRSLASNLGMGRKLKGRKTAVSLSRPDQTATEAKGVWRFRGVVGSHTVNHQPSGPTQGAWQESLRSARCLDASCANFGTLIKFFPNNVALGQSRWRK